jgi:hypothetical protein
MSELSRSQTPPGGWVYYQPQTGWHMPNPVSVTFSQAVSLIIKHRLANGAISAKNSLSTNQTVVEEELDTYTRLRLGIPAVPKTIPLRSLPSLVAGAAAGVKRAAQGTGVIIDWLTSGGAPVDQATADKRAKICVECPKNVEGSWYTVAPAELIRNTLSARSELKLQTPYDESLKSCDVCKCLLRLKAWVPLHFIKDHTPANVMAEFPPNCWINK